MSLEQNQSVQEENILDNCNNTYETSSINYEEDDIDSISSPKKRRKVDKDGFLCPATPDIPITSCQYGLPKPQHLESKDLDSCGYEEQTYEGEDIQLPSDDNIIPQENVLTQHYGDVGSDTKDRSGQPVAEIMQDLGQESKMLYNQWAEMFRESENFENFCPVRLEKLIEQAKQLEESLLKQKDLLCSRLNVISHIIRTSITEGPGGDN